MKNIKKNFILVCIFILAMSLTACMTKGTSAKKTETNKAAFTYSIIDDTYTENKISIKFPQLTKASDTSKSDSVNKEIQDYIKTKLDSLKKGQEDMGDFTLDLNYKTLGYDNKVLSISYQGYSHFEKAAYPVNAYYTQNIELGEVKPLHLKDLFKIDNNFIEAFKAGTYSSSIEGLDLGKSGVNIKETIENQYSNNDLISLFQKDEANFVLTSDGIIISIEVPHVLGDHLEMSIPYKSVETNMIKSSSVWKNYSFTNTNNQMAKQTLKEYTMDAALKKNLDVFFSNFSEANVKSFEKDKIDDSSLISFGVKHIIINNDKLIQYDAGNKNEGYIKTADVDTMTSYYFGKKVTQHKTVEGYTFENGLYKLQKASGETYTFSQIDKLYDLGSNKYKAEVSIYTASSGFTGDAHGTMSDWKASGEDVPVLSNKVTATIEKISGNGTDHYILIDYIYNKG